MKRIALTALVSVYLPACAGDVANNSADAGDAGVNDNVRIPSSDEGGAELGTSAVPTSGGRETVVTTTATGSTLGEQQGASTSTVGRSSSGGSEPTDSTVTTATVAATSMATTPSSAGGVTSTDGHSESTQDSGSAQTADLTASDDSASSAEQESDLSDVSPAEPAFDIDLVFLDDSESSNAVVDAFERAEAFWEELIIGDLPDIETRRQPCNGSDIYVEGVIDDLQIFVAVGAIDGPDGVLGAAGPCLGRPTWQGGLPLAGFMQFDSEDLERYAQQGRLDEVIIHEMGHVLGFGGVLWQEQGYLADPSEPDIARDTHFTGEKAIAAFDAIGGNAYTDAKVPVENTGGQGTANGHWREDVMGNEMMTSYMTNLEAVLSTVTLAALEDMGYEVDYTKAGGYEWPPPDERTNFFSLRVDPELPPINLADDILDIPFVTVE